MKKAILILLVLFLHQTNCIAQDKYYLNVQDKKSVDDILDVFGTKGVNYSTIDSIFVIIGDQKLQVYCSFRPMPGDSGKIFITYDYVIESRKDKGKYVEYLLEDAVNEKGEGNTTFLTSILLYDDGKIWLPEGIHPEWVKCPYIKMN